MTDLNDLAVSLIRDWYEEEPARRRSRIGIPNAALHVLEVFRHHWPLREGQFLTSGGGQVAGLSGISGDAIVGRYDSSLRSMGTEAGRTSRSTPAAARRLSDRLNALPRQTAIDPSTRAVMSDKMQLWIVEKVLAPQLRGDAGPTVSLNPREPLEHALRRYFDRLADRPWKQTASRLLVTAAEVAVRTETPVRWPERGRTERDALDLGDTSIVIAELPTFADVETCEAALAAGKRCLLLTPEDRLLASAQLLEAAGLSGVEVDSATRFVARLIDLACRFDVHVRQELIDEINQRLSAAGTPV